MSSIETAILCAGILALSFMLGDAINTKQNELYSSYPFFQSR